MGLYLIPLLIVGAIATIIFDDDDDSDDSPEGAEIRGDDDPQELTGTDGNDTILGFEGDDTIDGGAGDDRIFGNEGADVVVGGAGDDRIFLGDGPDTTVAGDLEDQAGDDFIRGGAGADEIVDLLGANTIFGDAGADQIATVDLGDDERTPDTVSGGFGDDLILADDGDVVTLGQGADALDIDRFFNDVPEDQEEAVTVTDFDPAEDVLGIAIDGGPGNITVTEEQRDGVDVAVVEVDGLEVAYLQGVAAADLNNSNLAVFTI